jgi:hypothetical protein
MTAPAQMAAGKTAPIVWTRATPVLRSCRATLALASARSASAKQMQTVKLAPVAVQSN